MVIEEMDGTSRAGHMADARQIAYYLCVSLLGLPVYTVAKEFGGKERSTIHRGYTNIREAVHVIGMQKDKIIKDVSTITKMVHSYCKEHGYRLR